MKYLRIPFVGNSNNKSSAQQPQEVINNEPTNKIDRKATYILKDDGSTKNYTIATCCNPIPGDDVLGYVNENENVIVHKRSCPVAMRLKSSFGPRLVSTQWDDNIIDSFPATIEITGIDQVGVLNQITRIISNDLAVNIRNLNIETNDGLFKGTISVLVHNIKDVERMCDNIKKIKEVKSATRIMS